MKRLACTTLLLSILSPEAFAAKVEWRGTMCITVVAAACPAGDWEVACYGMRYRPPNLGDNGTATHFSFGNENFRYGLDLDSGSLIGTVFQPVSQTSVTAFGFSPPGTSLRFTSQKPLALAATTKSVEIAGTIKDVDGNSGCNLTFRAAGVLVP